MNIDTVSVEDNKEIKAIGNETIHKICSGQVILDISIAVKELIENAVDAGATIIDIYLKEYGSELIEVSDNGSGIHESNFQNLTLKHFTSKIREFNDLEQLITLGFRGEALSSLCSLSDVEITTCHSSAGRGTKLKYDTNGKIIHQEIFPRQQGTSVILKNIFSSLPVRRKQFLRNMKKELVKLCNLLYAYCLLPLGIKYLCTHMTNKGTKTKIVATDGSKIVKENIINVFGVKQLSTLIQIELIEPTVDILEEYSLSLNPGEELPFDIDCLISSALHGSGRSSSDRQFYYINNRPCEPHKLMKLVNEVYKQFNSKQYPFVYLNIKTKSCFVDVNITPDKRQIFLEKEKLLLAAVKCSLLGAFKDTPSTFQVQNLEVSKQLSAFKRESKKSIKRSQTEGDVTSTSFMERFAKKHKSDETCYSSSSQMDITFSQVQEETNLKTLVDLACNLGTEKQTHCVQDVTSLKDELDDGKIDVTLDSPSSTADRREVVLKINLQSIRDRLESLTVDRDFKAQQVKFRSLIEPKSNKDAEEELEKNISKEEFSKMIVIGQFNLGFIIAQLNNDLFIVDQHASDEKYNFEQLQLNTVIDSQTLVSPKYLELTVTGKSIIRDFENVFNKNGFYFKKERDSDDNEKFYLTKIPISNKVVFGKADVDEMIFMLQENSDCAKICRPSKIRAMFASRACRKSVMIGKALSAREMKKLLCNMGTIEHPWNCPHGRPTMRHLINLNLIM
ncbi:mismatch repair endonuclease PMS2 [Rhynchophorus ferrugineus]|uniref:mismatch repair endonuclease PMS2 n=1 Tax=Rhynchophorus ferrugineus TaxID=354439 RepID=UPI003FCC30D4